jgi:hypothetical protein
MSVGGPLRVPCGSTVIENVTSHCQACFPRINISTELNLTQFDLGRVMRRRTTRAGAPASFGIPERVGVDAYVRSVNARRDRRSQGHFSAPPVRG